MQRIQQQFANQSCSFVYLISLLPKTQVKSRFKDPEKIARSIQRASTISYRLGSLAQESINVVLSVLVREIRALEKNIQDLDKVIEQLVVVIPKYQCLTSVPGIGKMYTAGLIAEIGQIERFKDQTKLAKYASLC
ncbi:transposase [Enterococcus sp. DIV0421]